MRITALAKETRIALSVIVLAAAVAGCASIHMAAQNGDLDRVKAIVESDPAIVGAKESNYGATPLHQAAGAGHTEIVRYLLSKGADANAKDSEGNTALHYISLLPWIETPPEVVSLLVKGGADLNARNGKGETPLHTAAEYQNLSTIKLLVTAGANVNMQDSGGFTPLTSLLPLFMVRMQYEPEWRYTWDQKMTRDLAILDVLLDAGANVNTKDPKGNTALHLVTYNVPEPWQVQVAEKLVKHGAVVTAKNNDGKTAIDMSAPALRNYLQRAQGK